MDPAQEITSAGVGRAAGADLTASEAHSAARDGRRLVTSRRMVALLGLFKLSYLTLLCVVLWLWPDFDTGRFYQVNARWPREGGPVFASHFATWDAAHYLYLSEVGYQSGVPSCAFYPLWPLLVRWLAPLAGGSCLVVGVVLSNIFSLAAWILFYRHTAKRWGTDTARWSLAFLIAFPGALFFQFNYTESLFFLLLMGLWVALEERRYGWACLAGALLPMTRGPGIFTVLPIAMYALLPVLQQYSARHPAASPDLHGLARLRAWMQPRPVGAPGLQFKAESAASCRPRAPTRRPVREFCRMVLSRQTLLAAVPILAVLWGWGVYFLYMQATTGNALEGFAAQKYWNVHSVGNLVNVPKFIIGFFNPWEWHEFNGSVLDRFMFSVLLGCLPLVWRADPKLLIWVYVLGVLPAMSGTFVSFTRFCSCAFPIFIGLGWARAQGGARWMSWLCLSVFAALHVVLVWRFVNFRWAG
jgi:hypothetical protein